MTEVLKFGGSSLADSTAMQAAVKAATRHQDRVLIVVSAMQGMTDILLGAARDAAAGKSVASAISIFRKRHEQVIAELQLGNEAGPLTKSLDETTEELAAICQGLATLGEPTVRVLDRTAARGERMSAQIFAALLRKTGHGVTLFDAQELIYLDRQFGALFPNLAKCEAAAKKLELPWQSTPFIVVAGFIGTGPEQETVTLGRGGSDLSATVLGHAVNATGVFLYKEVAGCLTADPRYVPEARLVPELHYREAAELAYYGAKVLHSRTIIPLIAKQIPLYVRHTFNPESAGTRIAGDVAAGAFPVKALTAILGQAMIAIEGKGMMGVPGIAARTFQTLAAQGASVTIITQASSEASICLAVPEADAAAAAKALREAFHFEIEHGLVDDIRVTAGQAIVAVVGLGMRGTKGIAARTFTALARAGVNIEAIAQGSSELNISTVINQDQVAVALASLHREYRLEKLQVFPLRDRAEVGYSLFGFGQIGRTLLRQIVAQQPYFAESLHVKLHAISLMDSRSVLSAPDGLSADALEASLAYKERGQPFAVASSEKLANTDLNALITRTLSTNSFERNIFIDTTASESDGFILRALESGMHVVLANKKPLAVPQQRFDQLVAAATKHRVMLRYEATVGAGLPILDTLAKLREAGDDIFGIVGCLSGTLGYLMSELQSGAAFSDVVRQAHAKGFTEPDPREDLCGMDVARKAIILARTIGMRLDLMDVRVQSLYPSELDQNDARDFIEGLKALDQEWQQRIASARAKGCVWRYVARIAKAAVSVGLEEMPIDSPFGRLQGTDNQIAIHTRRYDKNQLIVTGPGAGAEVTAAGVLNDILAIATAKEF